MDFSLVKSITIPEGNVIKLVCGDVILWQRLLSRLPKEYQELAYISAYNNVNSYIDLGFSFDTKAKIYMMQKIGTQVAGNNGYIFGAAENSGVYRCMLTSPFKSNGGSSLYGSDGSAFNLTVATVVENADNEFEMILEKGHVRITNLTNNYTNKLTNQVEYTMTNNLYLFAQNYNGTPRFGYDRTIKYFKYYDKNGELTHDLIPCYRKIDNKIGMYNVAKKQFFKNIGEGEFTAGHTDRYVNLLPWATDTNGTIYNGIGYKDTTRLSSSGGGKETSAVKPTMCTSGFIPVKVGDVVRIKGSLPVESIASYLMTYDYNKTFIKHNQFGQHNPEGGYKWQATGTTWFTYENDTLTIPLTEENFGAGITYFRFSMHMDENTIVTVNREIESVYENLAEPLPNNIGGTSKWVNGYRFSSSGIAVEEGTTLSNYISCKNGDIIRIKGVNLRENADRIALYIVRNDTNTYQWNYGYHNVGVDLGGKIVTELFSHEDGVYTFKLLHNTPHIIEGFRFAMPTPTDASRVIVTVNQEIPITNLAEPLPNNTTDTSKWVNGYRISGNAAVSASGATVSNLIPCKGGDVIRIKGVKLRDNEDRVAVTCVDNGSSLIMGYYNVGVVAGASTPVTFDELKDGVYKFTLSDWGAYVINGFRFAMPTPTDPSQVIVTVNEEISSNIKPKEEIFNNWVPYSTEDDDITIYNNGLGYKDGYRVRSGGGEAENKYATATGYIPVKAGDVVRVKGAEFLHSGTENAINVYDESFAVLGQMAGNSSYGYGIFTEEAYANYQFSSVVENPEGVYTWVVPPNSDIRYMRVTANTFTPINDGVLHGDGLSVTVNEYQSGNLFDQNDPNIVLGARINSSGTAVTYADGQLVTGWIEGTNGDVFTISSDKSQLTNAYTGMIALYTSDKTYIGQCINEATAVGGWTWSSDKLSGTINIPNAYNTWTCTGCVYVRFCIPYTDINSIVITKR